MPRTGSFGYVIDGGTDQAAAMALLSDMSRQTDLHPLIVKVEEAPPPERALRRYLITDRIPFGPFHYTIVYTADVLTATADRVITEANQKPKVKLVNDTRLTTTNGKVRGDVKITITAPTLLFAYAFRQARTAHLKLAKRIGELLNNPPA